VFRYAATAAMVAVALWFAHHLGYTAGAAVGEARLQQAKSAAAEAAVAEYQRRQAGVAEAARRYQHEAAAARERARGLEDRLHALETSDGGAAPCLPARWVRLWNAANAGTGPVSLPAGGNGAVPDGVPAPAGGHPGGGDP